LERETKKAINAPLACILGDGKGLVPIRAASTVSNSLLQNKQRPVILSGSINVALLQGGMENDQLLSQPYLGFEVDLSSLFDCQPGNGAFAPAFVEQVIAESRTLTADLRQEGMAHVLRNQPRFYQVCMVQQAQYGMLLSDT
jgi:hypothetical protein